MTWRARVAAVALFTIVPSLFATPALAAQSITAGTNKCTVTAIAPKLSKTSLTGSASVVCTVATTVTLEFGVVEMDGTLEDVKIPVAVAKKSMAVKANTAVIITTASATCLNTETGNEEYATKVRVSLSGPVSAYDRTSPANDSYIC